MICIALTICKHACKVDCDVKSATGPTPLLTQSRTKDAWFFASFEAYKMAGVVRRRKNGGNAFRTGAKIHFSKKIFWVMGTLTFSCYSVASFLLCIFKSSFSLPATLHFQKTLASDALFKKRFDTNRFRLIRHRSYIQ